MYTLHYSYIFTLKYFKYITNLTSSSCFQPTMNVKDAEQLIREISESNNINDLSFVWPKESIPSALPLGDAEGATRDLNRLLDLLAIVKPVHGAKKPIDYKHMIRLIELYDLVPQEVTNKLKIRLSEVFNDNDLIPQLEIPNKRETPISYKDKLNPDSDKFKEALANFNSRNLQQSSSNTTNNGI